MNPLRDQVTGLASGTVSSRALVETALAEARDSLLNAFRVVRGQDALDEADAADRRLAAGERLPLLGVPFAIKDDMHLAGYRTMLGSAGQFPTQAVDGEVVRKLRAAGAVIIGKTNTPEFGQWPLTGGSFGHTRNPWHRDHTPGGSSGGSAAAVAAGIVAGAVGTDGAGSVRIPSSWTHLVGIKPQRGRISTSPERELFNGLTVIGPIARSVADAALLLDVLSGSTDLDRDAPPAIDALTAVDADPGRLRIAMSTAVAYTTTPSPLSADVRLALGRVVRDIRELGHVVTPRDPDYGVRLGLSFLPRSLSGVAQYQAHTAGYAQLDPRTKLNAEHGRRLSGRVLRWARRIEPELRHRVGRIFDDVDVILAPVTAVPPLPVDAIDGKNAMETFRIMSSTCPYAWPWNVLGWPSIAIPAGFTESGLPVGVQLMGPEGSEPLLISLAAQIERLHPWATERPSRWW